MNKEMTFTTCIGYLPIYNQGYVDKHIKALEEKGYTRVKYDLNYSQGGFIGFNCLSGEYWTTSLPWNAGRIIDDLSDIPVFEKERQPGYYWVSFQNQRRVARYDGDNRQWYLDGWRYEIPETDFDAISKDPIVPPTTI